MATDLINFGLSKDPFPLQPGPTVTNWAGRPEERAVLTDIIYTPRSIDIGSSEFAVILGDYGNGKSHSLRFFNSLINTDPACEPSISIYVPTTKMTQRVSFLRLYQEIMNIIGDNRIRALATGVSKNFVLERDSIESTLTAPQFRAGEGQEAKLNDRVYALIDEADRPMVTLMRRIAEEDDSALSFIRGSNRGLPDIGLPNPIDNDFVAARSLGTFFRVLTQPIGEQSPVCLAAYLFLDEVESMMDDRPVDVEQFFQGIRNLVNELPYNFCLLLSFSSPTALLEAILPQHILQRMTRNYVELSELLPDRAKDFIAEVMSDSRPPDFSNSNPFHPFTEESIELVLERLPQITPRRLFRILNAILIRSIRREGLMAGQEISVGITEDILDAGQYY